MGAVALFPASYLSDPESRRDTRWTGESRSQVQTVLCTVLFFLLQ